MFYLIGIVFVIQIIKISKNLSHLKFQEKETNRLLQLSECKFYCSKSVKEIVNFESIYSTWTNEVAQLQFMAT